MYNIIEDVHKKLLLKIESIENEKMDLKRENEYLKEENEYFVKKNKEKNINEKEDCFNYYS